MFLFGRLEFVFRVVKLVRSVAMFSTLRRGVVWQLTGCEGESRSPAHVLAEHSLSSSFDGASVARSLNFSGFELTRLGHYAAPKLQTLLGDNFHVTYF